MNEFTENVYLKLEKPYLVSGNMSFLEIGVGSGLLRNKLLPYAKTYDATDISDIILEKCRCYMKTPREGDGELFCLYAHEIDRLADNDKKYDAIIMNSIMQYFLDYTYAEDVLVKCRALLNVGGIVFCGDILDEDKRVDILQYAFQGKKEPRRSKELFYDKEFFSTVSMHIGFSRCEFSDKIYTIPNELSLFRYDVILYM